MEPQRGGIGVAMEVSMRFLEPQRGDIMLFCVRLVFHRYIYITPLGFKVTVSILYYIFITPLGLKLLYLMYYAYFTPLGFLFIG
jgi:hypothetical protein